MSKENQIEEMAKDIKRLDEVPYIPNATYNFRRASKLYSMGYRKQKEGENVSGTPSLYECSVCHWRDNDTYTADTSEYNYCPNCGARMKDGE